MPPTGKKTRKSSASSRKRASSSPEKTEPEEVLAWLERRGTRKQIRELDRYGITARDPFGVPMGELQKRAREIGKDHELATALWATGRYEARLLATLVDDPDRVTIRQMQSWASDFDSWAIVDTACFHLFDRTKHAWKMVARWAGARAEFTRRAAFAILWGLSVHDREAEDERFLSTLELVEKAATDERRYVMKAVSMALKAVGKRNAALNAAAIETAERLVETGDPTARKVGREALRELRSASVRKRLAAKRNR